MRWIVLLCLWLPPALHAAGYAEIRKCVRADGAVELRDTPCPPHWRTERLDVSAGSGSLSTIPATRPPAGLLKRAKRSMRETRAPSPENRAFVEPDEDELRCAEYEKREDEIDRRLRKGYSAGQGNRLRAERRRIRRLLADACR